MVESPFGGKEVVVVGGREAGTVVDIYSIDTGLWRPGNEECTQIKLYFMNLAFWPLHIYCRT